MTLTGSLALKDVEFTLCFSSIAHKFAARSNSLFDHGYRIISFALN